MVTTRRQSVSTSSSGSVSSKSTKSSSKSSSGGSKSRPTTPSRSKNGSSSTSTSTTTTPSRTTRSKASTTSKAVAASAGGGGGGGGGKAGGGSSTGGNAAAIRLIVKALGIYACFLFWGIKQEKVTTTNYTSTSRGSAKFKAMVTLNAFMALAATFVGLLLHACTKGKTAPFKTFWRAALSNTIASPLGYLSLQYISYPLMLLVKNCKLIPVMIVGALVNGVRYKTYEYVSVTLISLGVLLFVFYGKSSGHGHGHGAASGKTTINMGSLKAGGAAAGSSSLSQAIEHDNLWEMITALFNMLVDNISWTQLGGLCLASVNLLIDGFTNAEQDRINHVHKVSPYFMMAMVNIWSLSFASLGLLLELLWRGSKSQLATAIDFLSAYPEIRVDLVAFSLANALGQVFIYSIIEDFGSLVSVTVTVTRKMISFLLSIVLNKHTVQPGQWAGVVSLFGGLLLKIFGGGGKGGHGHGHGGGGEEKKKTK